MPHIHLLGLGLVGALGTMGFASPASAHEGHADDRGDRVEVRREGDRDVRARRDRDERDRRWDNRDEVYQQPVAAPVYVQPAPVVIAPPAPVFVPRASVVHYGRRPLTVRRVTRFHR